MLPGSYALDWHTGTLHVCCVMGSHHCPVDCILETEEPSEQAPTSHLVSTGTLLTAENLMGGSVLMCAVLVLIPMQPFTRYEQ